MPRTPTPTEGAVTPAEALRFHAVASEIMTSPRFRVGKHESPDGAPHIGTLGEKRLHAAIKFYLCSDEDRHERPLSEFAPAGEGKKSRRMVADIVTDGHIMEVQTGGFYPLKPKLSWYLENTSCRVTVVHPIAAEKYLSWIDPEDGHIISRRRAPRRGRVRDVAKELYWLSDFIGHPRFSLRLLLVEMEEYRLADGWGKDGKRGSNRYEIFPTALLGDVTLTTPADYAAYFLPAALSTPDREGNYPPFTAAAYAKATGIRGRATYGVIHLLEKLELVEECPERVGRSRSYAVCRHPEDL